MMLMQALTTWSSRGAAQRRAWDPYPPTVVMDSGPRGLRPLTRNDAEQA